MEYRRSQGHKLRHWLSAPFIYAVLFPLVLLDMFIEIYHHIAFPLYRLPLIKRSEYIAVDRHKLKYLNFFEKANCMYCGYANGLLHYAGAIAGRTEQYWCGIQHKKKNQFRPPKHHKNFVPHDDEAAFHKYYN